MGDITKAALWRFCRIFVGFDHTTVTVPADVDTPFGVTWEEVGILAKGGPTENHTWGQNTKLYGRNGELVRFYRDEYSVMVDFSFHELNDTTFEVLNPGSNADAIYTPRPVPVALAFEYQEGETVERYITANYAEISRAGAVVRAENGLVAYPVSAEVFPDLESTNSAGEPQFWIRQATADLGS